MIKQENMIVNMTDESYFWSHMRKFLILVMATILDGAWAVRDQIERVYQKSFQAKFGKIGSVVQRGEEIFKLFLICQNESIGRAQ